MLSVNLVDDMTVLAAKKYLKLIIQSLNALDEEDFFGTEGRRTFLGFEED
jgi:hypothetical protein